METTVRRTASTPLLAPGGRNHQGPARTPRPDDECSTSGGTGQLCLHCTGPESD